MDSRASLASARALRNEGRHQDALAVVRQVLAAEPDSADAHWIAGLAFHSLGRRDESIASLRDTVRLAPRWAPGWAKLGMVLAEQGRIRDGRAALFRALKIEPNHEFSLRQLARLAREEKDYESELNFLLDLYAIGKADAHDLNSIGIAYFNQKRFWDAIEYYHLSNAKSPSPAPLFNLALIYNDPEISQDVDATDCLRRALLLQPDHKKAADALGSISGRLRKLAREALNHGETPVKPEDWFQFYLNPFEILGADDRVDLERFDAKWIQLSKKRIKAELELEDGKVESLDGLSVDPNRIMCLCDELFDEDKKAFHWNVFQTPLLLRFLTRGEIRHFLYSDSYFPIETLKALDWPQFQRWLSEPFARQYNLVLSRALEQRALPVIECLFDGRRWVLREHDDICFAGAHRYVDRLLEPLQQFAEQSKVQKPQMEYLRALLQGFYVVDFAPQEGIIVPVMNLLPEAFRDQQSKAVRCVRDVALSCYNVHDDSELSRSVLQLSNLFSFKNADLRHRLEDDFKKIEELIKKERTHEAKFSLGNKPIHVTKDGVRQGDKFLSVSSVASIRWGITVSGTSYEPIYEFLLTFRNDDLEDVSFSWRTSQNLEEQQAIFNKLIQAALIYIVPSIIEKVKRQLDGGEHIHVGNCTMESRGIVFQTQGWLTSKTRIIPWPQVGTDLKNGILTVFDKTNPSLKTSMPLKESDNAVVLQFLARSGD